MKLGVYICCGPDPYLRKNLVSSIGNLNSSLCYQTRVKLQRFLPILAGADMPWWTTGRDQTSSPSYRYHKDTLGACKIISRSSGNPHPDTRQRSSAGSVSGSYLINECLYVTATSLLWPGACNTEIHYHLQVVRARQVRNSCCMWEHRHQSWWGYLWSVPSYWYCPEP